MTEESKKKGLWGWLWWFTKFLGVSTILLLLFALSIFCTSVIAISKMEVSDSSLSSDDVERCTEEDECIFDEMKPSGFPTESTHISATYYDTRPWGLHGAVDITGGGEIKATHDGVVSIEIFKAGSCTLGGSTYTYGAYPNVNVINDEYKTEYLHMIDIQVENGEIVKKGDVLGTMGNEGCSTGTHLHYEVHKKEDGAWVRKNPEHGYL